MSRAKTLIAASIVIALSGCAYDDIGTVSYRSDGTHHHTAWGKKQPAPASASSVQITPQNPHVKPSYEINSHKHDGDATQNRTYYRAPTKSEIDKRASMLMQMSQKVQERAPAPAVRPASVDRGVPGPKPSASDAQVALAPLPGRGTQRGLIDQVSHEQITDVAAEPTGRYQVFLDFDKSIPVSALKTLLGIESGTFSSRVVASGDRRVYLGGYDSETGAKAARSRVEADTGLTPQIREKRS